MLVENQKVIMRWVNTNRKWYESKGYQFTKIKDEFEVRAEDLMPTSKTTVAVTCDYCGETYCTLYGDYVKGIKRIPKSCCNKPECKSKKQSESKLFLVRDSQYDKFVKLCLEKGYTPISTLEEYSGANKKLKYLCPVHGIEEISLSNLEQGNGCKACASERIGINLRLSVEDVINIVESKNNNILLNPYDYISTNTNNLRIICGSCNKEYTTSLSAIRASTGKCRSCGNPRNNKLTKEELIRQVESINNNKVLNPEDYITVGENNLKIVCGSCHGVFITSLASLRTSSGKCPSCSPRICQTLETNVIIERARKYNFNILNPENYVGYLDKTLMVKCPDCGEEFLTSLKDIEYRPFTTRCEKCSINSKGEYTIARFLSGREIKYTRQEKFDGQCRDIKPLPFDFYLPFYNLCIEFNGIQHYKPIEHFGGQEAFEIRVKHDKIKKQYCEYNDIDYLCIPYWDFDKIEEILIEKLNISTFITPRTQRKRMVYKPEQYKKIIKKSA